MAVGEVSVPGSPVSCGSRFGMRGRSQLDRGAAVVFSPQLTAGFCTLLFIHGGSWPPFVVYKKYNYGIERKLYSRKKY